MNLASLLLFDGFERDYEVAVAVSNDSDLLLPIALVRERLGLEVGVINPHRNARPSLQSAAGFYRTISDGALSVSHFPDELTDHHGRLHKPEAW